MASLAERVTMSLQLFATEPALLTKSRSWTYDDLRREVDRRRSVLSPYTGEILTICGPRVPEVVLWVVSAAAAGVTPLVVAQTMPLKAREAIAHQAGAAAAVMVQDDGAEALKPIPVGTSTRLARSGGYSVATSGTTGTPKVILHADNTLVGLADWQIKTSMPRPRTALFSEFGFDVFLQEIFATLLGGGPLVLLGEPERLDSRALVSAIDQQYVERLFLPFVALQALCEAGLRRGVPLGSLREVVTAGEALIITQSVRDFFSYVAHGAKLVNQYGPAETHVVSAYELPAEPEGWPQEPPIGRPLPGFKFELTGSGSNACLGELSVSGPGVALGYLSSGSVRAFSPRGEDGRSYKTGDRVRAEAGDYYFVGRKDDQVKIAGHRLHLLEVESALLSIKSVSRCAVVVRSPTEASRRRLCAYYVGSITPAELRSHASTLLAKYAVPTFLIRIDEMPLTPNGKVDRQALANNGAAE